MKRAGIHPHLRGDLRANNESKGAHAHHVIKSMRVTGGFLGGTNLELADGLNCFIGGRGAGKTTALEFLRFALGLMPDPRVNVQRHRTLEGLIKANLGAGRINVELRTKTGMRYTAGRGIGDSVQVVNENGVAVPVALDRDQIFSADVFSQNEIEEIACSPAAQLELLDRFEEKDAASIRREIEQLTQELDRSTVLLRRLDEEVADLHGKASEVPVLEERLKGLVTITGPDATKINAAHEAKARRAREVHLGEVSVAAIERCVREAADAQATFLAATEGQFGSAMRNGPNADLILGLEDDLKSFSQTLSSAVDTIAASARALIVGIRRRAQSLLERHAQQEAEYRALVEQSEEESGRAAERNALQAALIEAQSAASERGVKQRQRDDSMLQRKTLLMRLSELRDRRFALRKNVSEQLSRQFASLRVTVEQAADLSRYRELLTERLKGAGVKQWQVAERLSLVLLPTELAQIVASNDHKTLSERSGFESDRARRVLDGLRDAAYDIEIVDLDDRPCIELKDGEQYKESPRLSTGQRCTTILPILLVQSERPLLIDQPEDNLDNAFVYDTIVSALRAAKGNRQVIFVTHNPNIPVLGSAERVFVFASDGERAMVQKSGTVDECKDQIERILEGGREAFLERKVRYGH